MKFTCTQENLNQGFQIVQHATSKNLNLPILNNVLINLKENEIKLLTTNLDIGISYTVRGKIEKEGSFTVNAKLISDYVNLLPKENIDVELDNKEQLHVKCSGHQTKIKGLNAADYPLIPELNKKNKAIITVELFREALNSVLFAVSKNENRPELNGILFKFVNNQLVLAATDSYRLAERKINIKQNGLGSVNVIVPSKTLQELVRVLSILKSNIKEGSEMEIYLSEGQILFIFDNFELVSRLIEGNYPDYEQIIPVKFNTQVICSVSDLLKNIKTVSLFVKENINDINLQFQVNNDDPLKSAVHIRAANEQLGESDATTNANITGMDNNIVVNYVYLLEGLNNIKTEEVKLEIIDNLSPIVIRSANQDQYLYIVMPIRQ
ncbi:MAG TPA: DNA polymerase III subunit beta [bacterium]|nr:DNA polymerase III subunit beta [bacterium]